MDLAPVQIETADNSTIVMIIDERFRPTGTKTFRLECKKNNFIITVPSESRAIEMMKFVAVDLLVHGVGSECTGGARSLKASAARLQPNIRMIDLGDRGRRFENVRFLRTTRILPEHRSSRTAMSP